jgi:hypothetical protein
VVLVVAGPVVESPTATQRFCAGHETSRIVFMPVGAAQADHVDPPSWETMKVAEELLLGPAPTP